MQYNFSFHTMWLPFGLPSPPPLTLQYMIYCPSTEFPERLPILLVQVFLQSKEGQVSITWSNCLPTNSFSTFKENITLEFSLIAQKNSKVSPSPLLENACLVLSKIGEDSSSFPKYQCCLVIISFLFCHESLNSFFMVNLIILGVKKLLSSLTEILRVYWVKIT